MEQSKRLITHTGKSIDFQWYSEQFSRPLFRHGYSEPKVLRDAIISLCFRVKIQPREATVEGLEKLILDLFVRFETSEGFSTIGVFTSNGGRTAEGSQQYECLGFTGKALRGYLIKLEDAQLVQTYPGNRGHSTKVRASLALMQILKNSGLSLKGIRYSRIPPVVYTNDSGEIVERVPVEGTPYVQAGGDVVDRYNELLRYADISVGGLYLLPYEKQVQRIFRDAEATKDGRHYGPVWQILPSKARGRILINGHKVSECDVRSTHPLIAYALRCQDLTDMRSNGFDPYRLDQLSSLDGSRELIKASMLRMFNCKSDGDKSAAKTSAKRSIQGEINKSPDLYKLWVSLKDKSITLDNIIGWIEDNNKLISDSFFSGSWEIFNYHESNIIQRVIDHFTDKGVIVLTVFDSILIQKGYEDELHRVFTGSIATELMTIFMNPEQLLEWSKKSDSYSDSSAAKELIQARTYRDRFGS